MKALIPLLILLAGSAQAADRIERGRYLVNTSGCADCHTPMKMGANGPEPDAAPRSTRKARASTCQAARPMATGWSSRPSACCTA